MSCHQGQHLYHNANIVLSIFSELVHDAVKIYMDDFTPYGSDFQEALSNLGKFLDKCIEMNLLFGQFSVF